MRVENPRCAAQGPAWFAAAHGGWAPAAGMPSRRQASEGPSQRAVQSCYLCPAALNARQPQAD